MRDPENTRKTILLESANLFNTQGYKATSISDITKATGFTKGAIYRHFESKADLEKHALQRLSSMMFEHLGVSIKAAPDFEQKFEAIFSFFEQYMESPFYEGGCPLMNAAVEVDDGLPELRAQAQTILNKLKNSVRTLVVNGIENGQVGADIDTEAFVHIVIASLEGGIMMSKLEGKRYPIQLVIEHLRTVVSAQIKSE
ncbi:MAG: TetR family transcriptional regulator [Flavobacteriaceae bacterium]|nr:TetR family transcriptional regulator [Flavobacteriaceae bacterium]|tara:strand:+ start:19982 stop:20578 length:597 start_codon:yes stop_codon:yes gene_type:complete